MTTFIILGVILFVIIAFLFRTKIVIIVVELIGTLITFLLSDFTTPIAINFVNHGLNSPSPINEQLTKFGSWILFEFVYYIITNLLLKKLGTSKHHGEPHDEKKEKKEKKEHKEHKEEKEHKEHKKEKEHEKHHKEGKSTPMYVPIIKYMLFGMIFLIIASLVTNIIPNVSQVNDFPVIKQIMEIQSTLSKL